MSLQELLSVEKKRMGTIRKLKVVSPVPADIDVANSVEALHISAIAEELGLKPEEFDYYGKKKAKVGAPAIPSSSCSLFSCESRIHTVNIGMLQLMRPILRQDC